MEEETKTLREEILELKDDIRGTKQKKPKQFKLPFSARLKKGNLKKGYVTVGVISDNMAVSFVKEPIVDGTIRLGDTFHAVEEFDIFNYKGKPFIFQPKSKLNPYNPHAPKPLDGEHETYGQKYVMARMEGDKLISKKSMGIGLSIGALIIVGIIVYALFTGGGG